VATVHRRLYGQGRQDGTGVGQSNYPNGWATTVVGTRNVCVVTSRPTLVYVTVNGTPYGSVKSFGGTHVLADKNGPRNVAACG
jgi:hypothetical protein